MKINNYRIFGFFMIIIGIILFIPTQLDLIIRPFTQPILMGSSKGKDILFFILFGITLILSTTLDNEKNYKKFKSLNIPKKFKSNYLYLKLSLYLFFIITILGLVLEIYLRYLIGTNLNNIFVAANPNLTTTSLLHSHIYKSLFGIILSKVLTYIPTGIHTGSSLSIYTPEIANYLFILIPILYIIMIGSLQNRKMIPRLFLAFTSTIGIIGIIDGGFFATPTIGGIYGILIILLNEDILNDLTDDFLENSKNSLFKKLSLKSTKFKKYLIFNIKNIKQNFKINEKSKKFWKIWSPHLILIFIIILRFSIAIYGANDECYELDIYNLKENIDLSHYNVLNIKYGENKTVVYISNEYNEMELLNNLGQKLSGKCDSYSLTWNIYSYINKHTPL